MMDVQIGNLQKLKMYALTNPEKLPIIGKQLEKNIMQDCARRNVARVAVATRILEEIMVVCSSELTYIVVNIVNIVDLLLTKQNDHLLKIRATEIVSCLPQLFDINIYLFIYFSLLYVVVDVNVG